MCFSLLWLVHWAIWIIILIGIVAIVRIVVPWVFELVGVAVDPRVFRIVNIVVGIIVAIALIWLVYDLLVCAAGLPPIVR